MFDVITFQLSNNQFLLLEGYTFQCFLYYSASIHLKCEGLDMRTKLKEEKEAFVIM